jgi:ABC-type nitrate/sulfonate/bicarbonate transport system substrate-binding protein
MNDRTEAKRRTRREILQGMTTAAIAAGFPAPAVTQTLTKVPFQLSWIRVVQYGGYFAAQEFGYYREVGLDPEFMPGGPNVDGINTVASGKAMLGDRPSDQIIIAKGRGVPVKIIGAVYQRSPSGVMSLKSKPLRSIQEFPGKTIAVPAGVRQSLSAHMRRVGLDPATVNFIPVGTDPGILITGQVDGYYGTWTNQGMMIKTRGIDVEMLFVEDLGSNIYGGAIYAPEKVIATERDLLKRFLQASVRGFQYMVAHPRETAELVVTKYAAPGQNLAAQIADAEASRDFIRARDGLTHGLLWVNPDYLAPMIERGLQSGLIQRPFSIGDLVDQSIIREVHAKA